MVDKNDMVEDGENGSVVDFSNTEDHKFELLPNGTYNVQIVQCDYLRSKASNQPMWNMQLEVTEGDYQGRKLFTNLSFSEKAMPFTKGSIRAINPDLLSGPFDAKAVAESGDLLGIEVAVKVGSQTYEGEKRNNIKRFQAKTGNDFVSG